ncbi:MAG: LLM class flavin-dependent oxidoreductase [Planctomycetota bacterium]
MDKLCCVLIGVDSLLLECAERLLSANFEVVAVLSDAPRVRDWAQAQGIEVLQAEDLLASQVEHLQCDYLFSITWLKGLPEFLRALPRVAALNIQDSPLPRYSGPHGPAWALMAGERHYGVCWHLAEAVVGEGGILKRIPVAIEADDTSLSLNMKCFEAALAGFEQLLPDLAAENLQTIAVDEKSRSRFGADQRPEHWGCLDWNQSAKQLEATVRALDFGGYTNAFCMAKVVFGEEAVGVSSAIAEPSQEKVAAGTILAASERGLVVATADGNLRLTELTSLRGADLEVMDWMASSNLRIGQVLSPRHAGFLTGLGALLPNIASSEAAWLHRLRACDTLSLGYDRAPDAAPDSKRKKYSVHVPNVFIDAFPAEDLRAALRTACLVHLSRLSRQACFRVRYADEALCERIDGFGALLSASIPLGVEFASEDSFEQILQSVDMQLDACRQLPPFLKDLQGRSPDEVSQAPTTLAEIGVVCGPTDPDPEGSSLVYRFDLDGSMWLEYAANRLAEDAVKAMAAQVETLLLALADDFETPIGQLQLLPDATRQLLLQDWNDSTRDLPEGRLVHEMIAERAAQMGDQVAVVAAGETLLYAELNQRADHLASYLASLGAGPDVMVGICMQRTTDMMVALLAILKSGAGYLPLDPDFPPSRLQYMVEDSGVNIVLSDRWSRSLVAESVERLISMDDPLPAFTPVTPIAAEPKNLAYAIYTSGSTGDPKGVMLEHEQVTNFFLGMDERLGTEAGVWLAVTSLSFDISVLELLWTLTVGYKIVLFEGFDRGTKAVQAPAPHEAGQLQFSLMLWGAEGGGPGGENPYRLMLDAARFGDTHNFTSIWIPERHFHEFGGPYPNPAVAASAIAAVTENIGIRAGSVVVPLHDPVLMAEDWSMVDNLSGGRVGLAIASGWHPNDFVLDPASFEDRKQVMKTRMGTLRSLWRGEPQVMENPIGEFPEIITRPRPVQAELPIWLTAAGNPDTFRLAGEMGVHVLTHLLGQTTEEITVKIAIYRKAWREAGHPGSGHVTMMLHTMLGEDRETMREMARGPMCSYLAKAADLLKDHMSAWAAVRTPMNKGKLDTDFHLDDLEAQDIQDLLNFAYERYFETSALFGTPESCSKMIEKLRDLEVDEVACLIDFGGDPEIILQQLPYLEQLKAQTQSATSMADGRENLEELIDEHRVTHLQCTPSMATMLLAEPAIATALGSLDVMMVGGEALTEDLAQQLRDIVPGRVMNMYGLTETAIWSSTADILSDTTMVSLGQPLANNRFYVLDPHLQLVPPGLTGELYIAGLCVARGYHGRPDLTAEAFLPDPFTAGGTIYKSGDQVRQLEDGSMRFLGRGDTQVKVNGYRIELGEIEAALLAHEEVVQSIALVVENKLGVRVIVAHYVLQKGSHLEVEELRSFLRTRLPEYMVPREFHAHERFPQTNNGKTDRKALARGAAKPVAVVIPVASAKVTAGSVKFSQSVGELESSIESIWLDILGHESLDRNANFFDLGGHSLLTISLKRILKAQFDFDVPLVALFRHSTVRTLAAYLISEHGSESPVTTAPKKESAAAKRAALRKSRRGQA